MQLKSITWLQILYVGGSEKIDPGSDPMDLDLGSVGIIDPAFSFYPEIHWYPKSESNFSQEVQSDHRSYINVRFSSTHFCPVALFCY